MKRSLLLVAILLLGLASGENMELTGVIREARLGNPHGILEVEVDGEVWTVEVGQPWRNARAGLKKGDLSEGVEIRVIGEPAASERRLKVERLFLGDKEFVLYPDPTKLPWRPA